MDNQSLSHVRWKGQYHMVLAFHKVLEKTECVYSGPKAIGQIFGISYVYSLFWKFGL